MDYDIQGLIKESLISGASVEEAYVYATKAAIEHLYTRVQAGETAHTILREMKFPDDDGFQNFILPPLAFDEPRLYMVVAGGGIKDVPRATCMAEYLKDNPNPSRSDVEAAVAACLDKV